MLVPGLMASTCGVLAEEDHTRATLDFSMTLGRYLWNHGPLGSESCAGADCLFQDSEDSGFPRSKQDVSLFWGQSAGLMEILVRQPRHTDINSNHPMDKA